MIEAQCFAYSIHTGYTKMYYDLQERQWWLSMNEDISEFIN